jgi:hypothetical protein
MPWNWLKPRWRVRLSTLILVTIIVGMSVALVVFQRRQTRLLSALRSARSYYDEAIRLALGRRFDMPAAQVQAATLDSQLYSERG